MFIPRSLSKRAIKPDSNSGKPGPLIDSSNNSTAGSSSKRDVPDDEQNSSKSSDETSSDSSDGDDSSSESGSDSDSNPDSNNDEPTTSAAPAKKPTTTEGSTITAPLKRTQKPASEIAARLELALSDLSLWRNEPLFRRVAETQEWYIPFSRLHDHPLLEILLGNPNTRVPDAALVTALRTCGSGLFESRIKIRAPSNAAWKRNQPQESTSAGWVGSAGGYEVRSKAWANCQEGWMEDLSAMGEDEWNARTVYVERIPTTVRSIWALYHYATVLGRAAVSEPDAPSQIVQDVFVPTAEPSVVGPPSSGVQRFRGQAFVVFSSPELARSFSERWVWSPPPVSERKHEEKSGDAKGAESWTTKAAVEAAMISGLRSLARARWDELKSEYLEHQARVLRQGPKRQHNNHAPTPSTSTTTPNEPSSQTNTVQAPSTQNVTQAPVPIRPQQYAPAPTFPPGILAFARRLHPETNKTTLKTLFGRAFEGEGGAEAIEYLDFQKGVDSAHIRLRTPTHAQKLSTYFSTNSLRQRDALDNEGASSGEAEQIEVEVVSGTREVNYWAKVPEKVRAAALARAGYGGGASEDKEGDRRKKRRKV
ncbi:hypothetical protein BDV93DRAFT_545262 [Ceratobasidium sp. AG-I]|nr:hypothetical protein BDV93DRAFT_545262 [Ceratobasidium sp. AG-I]